VDQPVTERARRPPIFGPEPWTTVAGVQWSHFDRWFALVIVNDFDGDADALRRELIQRMRSSLHLRRDEEAKLSHLTDLQARIVAADIGATTLADADNPDKATLVKARRKVLDQALEGRAMTMAMRETPAALLVRRARFGYWEHFPVNPNRWYDKLAGRRPPTGVAKGRSFGVVERLRDRLARLDGPRRGGADRLALYRAFHTVGLELAENGDDSYGVIGELRFEAFRTYVTIDWADAGIEPAHYWQDLCELLVSEVYALTHRNETVPFMRVPGGQAEMIETILLGLADEYRAAYQEYQADEALQLIAWLHIAGRRYTHYVTVAQRLGSDHWIPIVALAESAASAGRADLAVDVFRAADQPGRHRGHLQDRCAALTGVRVDAPTGSRDDRAPR
jgi:hypothetical protein